MWIGLAILLVLLPFLSLAGRYVRDTSDAVWLSPGASLAKSFAVWRSSPFLGAQQRTNVAIPLGLASWLLRSAGLAPWAAERLWHGLVLFIAAAGVVGLVDRLRDRRTVAAPLVAALVYVLTPYTFGYGLASSAAFLSYALLPTLLLVTVRGVTRPGLAGPALFGLVTFLMGGGNGGLELFALLPPAAFVVWTVAIERSVPAPRAVRFALWSVAFSVGLNAYWILLLAGGGAGAPSLSGQAAGIDPASSYSETIRGLGLWTFYAGDRFGPLVEPVRSFVSNPILVLSSFAIPLGAVLSAWLVKWRYRLFFLLLATLSVVVAGAGFVSSPLGRLLDALPGRGTQAADLRIAFGLAGTLALSLAVLVGVGVEEAARRAPGLSHPSARRVLAAAAVVAVAANAFPLWAGRLYDRDRSAEPVPAYWAAALRYLDAREGDRFRAFVAPGAKVSFYRWGEVGDGLAAANPAVPTAQPVLDPAGKRFGSNLAAAIERTYRDQLASDTSATMLRYLGARDVVVQNDLDWQRSRTVRPAVLQLLVRDPSLGAGREFGAKGQNVTAPSVPPGPNLGLEHGLRPVQILAVPDPIPVVRAEAGAPIVLSGDAFGIDEMARAGLLDGNPPILYSGSLTPPQLARILSDGARLVVTDTNRRSAWSFDSPGGAHSYTLPADQALEGVSGPTRRSAGPVGFALFPDRPDAQTVAQYAGVRSIEASGYGSRLEALPQFRPVNAFDGDPGTSWLAGGGSDPVGQWVQVNFFQTRSLSTMDLQTPPAGLGRRVARARVEFSSGRSVVTEVRPGHTVVSFPPTKTRFVRVRILGVTRSRFSNPVGFSELGIPGVRVREVIQLPTDVIDLIRRSPGGAAYLQRAPLTYLFDRLRSDSPLVHDEETSLVRQFRVPTPRLFALSGQVRLSTLASDAAIDRVTAGFQPVQATSSSRFRGNPGFRASQVLDGDPATAWVPQGRLGQWVRIGFPERTVGLVFVRAQWFPGRTPITGIRLDFSDGSHIKASPSDLQGGFDLKFEPRTTTFLRITVTKVSPVSESKPGPVGISEVRLTNLDAHVAKPSDRMPCYSGTDFTLEGRPVPIRLSGTVGDLLGGGGAKVSTCDGKPVALAAGTGQLVAAGVFEPDSVALSTADGQPPAAASPQPRVTVHEARGGYDVGVRDARAPIYLSIGQNVDPGWGASVDGKSLGAPMVLDGFAAGWRVDRTGSFTVRVRFGRQRPYGLAIMLSALCLVAAVFVLAGSPILARRRSRNHGGLEPEAGPG